MFSTNEVLYEIDFDNNEDKDSFKMYKDDDGTWKIAARHGKYVVQNNLLSGKERLFLIRAD